MRRRNRYTNRRGATRLLKALKRHPLLSLAVAFSIGAGLWADSQFNVSALTQSVVSVSTFILTLVVYVLTNIGYGAVYVITGTHPVSGSETVLYVGMTTQKPYRDSSGVLRYPRMEQHLFGSVRYGSCAQPWSDTVTSWKFVHESYHLPLVLLPWLERINIKWRKPLYNDLHNRANHRRIDRNTMIAQRAKRDTVRR